MPMTKPSGAINPTVNATFSAHGSHTSEDSNGVTTIASSAVSSAISPRTLTILPSLRPSRRLLMKLPAPLDTSIEKITTVSAYVGCPRKSTNF